MNDLNKLTEVMEMLEQAKRDKAAYVEKTFTSKAKREEDIRKKKEEEKKHVVVSTQTDFKDETIFLKQVINEQHDQLKLTNQRLLRAQEQDKKNFMEIKVLNKKINDLNREIQEYEKDRERLIFDFESKIKHNKDDFEQQALWLREQKDKHVQTI